jgi:hypothetical protein
MPVELQGDAAAEVTPPVEDRLRAQLSDLALVDAAAEAGCASADCLTGVAATAGARGLVRVVINGEARDYTITVDLVDGESGEVVRSEEASCEICTYDEVADEVEQAVGNVKASAEESLSGPGAPVGATINIVSQPSDAVVRIDGEVVGSTPYQAVVDPGTHDIEISKEGFASRSERLSVGEEDERALEIKLRKDSGKVRLKQVVGWSAVGLAVPLVVTGIALLAIDENPYKKDCDGDNLDVNGTCRFRYNTLGGGVVALIGGLAAAGAGATLLVLDRKEQGKLEAWIGPGGGGIRGSF